MPARPSRFQIFTPTPVAEFMAESLLKHHDRHLNVLDAGAGAGALTDAVVDRAAMQSVRPDVTLIEQDPVLADHLSHLLADRASDLGPSSEVVNSDFIATARDWLNSGRRFSHIIMNPPYARIPANSEAGEMLRRERLAAPNLYAAFLWLGMDLLEEGGKLVAIVPRMLLSGPSFRHTRERLLSLGSLTDLHHFKDRKGVFGRDSVQQEVVIVGFVRAKEPAAVSYSISRNGEDLETIEPLSVPASRILMGGRDSAISLPGTLRDANSTPTYGAAVLPELADVSVGPVVDFRVADHITDEWEDDVPLIGAEAFATSKRRRGLKLSEATNRFIWPSGTYVIVRRISPPEYSPRLASLVLDATSGAFRNGVAFENHVLVIHLDGGPLTPEGAKELQLALNDSAVQKQVAERVGGTQINRADILSLRRAKILPQEIAT